MNKLSTEKRARILACLVEGNSIRATCRLTGAAKGTVLKLLADLGQACVTLHDEGVRGVRSQRVQCDEIWAYCQAKEKNVKPENKGVLGHGDVWTWTALDPDTKLMISWHLGHRGVADAHRFIEDLASRLANRVQLTTDGHNAYLKAIDRVFGKQIDYAQIVKLFANTPEGTVRYSPAKCTGVRRMILVGDPDPKHISTSHVERMNLSLRMGMRRMTRLTNGYSKKLENLRWAMAIHIAFYNFVKVHESLGTTPAVKARLDDHVWSLSELAALADSN